jgi:hypothetical protein
MTYGSKIIPPHGGYQKLKSYQMAEKQIVSGAQGYILLDM